MSPVLKKGDIVEHKEHGDGVILNLVTNDTVADVKFCNITKYVPTKSLRRKRVEIARRSLLNTNIQQAKAKRTSANDNLNGNSNIADNKTNNTSKPLTAKGLSDNENLKNIKQQLERQKSQQLEEEQKEKERKKREIELERRRKDEILKARKTALIKRIKNALEFNFLDADKIFNSDHDSKLIETEQYVELKRKFIIDWVRRELKLTIDIEQASAVAAIDGDIKVTARAGSGKTRTLVTRAIFLQKHCNVASQEILLLAFNSTAADEMKKRIAKSLGEHLPHVLTFHKLAHALVHPEEDLIFDETNSDRLGFSREIKEVINKQRISKKYSDRIKELMLSHFRDDWEQIINGKLKLTMDEFLVHRRKLPRESLKGDYVKSFGEKLIANTLFEHDVDYRYERNFRWDDFNYRPDFTIPPLNSRPGVIIEYFGLQGDAEYDDLSDKKRAFWAEQPGWKFLEFTPNDIVKNGVDNFVKTLTKELQKAGVNCNRLSEEEVWRRVKERAIDSFTKVMRTFVSRCRKLNLNTDKLKAMVDTHKPCSTTEKLFLDVAVSVYQGYMERLKEIQKEDFDGLMWRAVERLRGGKTEFKRNKGLDQGDLRNIRFIMIDEFQDFSQMFFDLVSAIRSNNQNINFFCVGDDWQAINAFAGSDLKYFEKFTNYFLKTSQYNICTNYRSPIDVVKVSNSLMNGLGVTAQAYLQDYGQVLLCKLDTFKPSSIEWERHSGDEITPAILRVVRNLLDRRLNVVLLARRSGLQWYVNYSDMERQEPDVLLRFLEHLRSYLPEKDRERITISTSHKYKGLESDAVIVLDATARCYPLIHPHWFFLRVFNDSINKIEQEERRLLYVAITRAQKFLALFTEYPLQSPYIDDIQKSRTINSINWADLPPVASLENSRLEIRVFDAFDVKEQLKKLKYNWNDKNKYWHKAVIAEGFSIDTIMQQPWASDGVRVEVYSEELKLLYQSGN